MECLEDRTVFSAGQFVPDELLLKFKPGVSDADKSAVRSLVSGASSRAAIGILQTAAMRDANDGEIEILHGMSDVPAAAALLAANPNVAFAEPNWLLTHAAVSNDPLYTDGSLWGMYGDDLPTAVGPAGTTNSYGSQAEKAWNAGYTGSAAVYVGIIDEGVQITHPDLAANAWNNPFDAPGDSIDNDGNGYIDDTRGWDFYNGDSTVYDGTADDHGTHVTGTIGATGGNALGVAGVNWNVTFIPGKFLGTGGGTIAGAIEALDYMTDLKTRHGLNIVATNNSWGGGGFSNALLDAITRGAQQNILFVAAAGNSGINSDSSPQYPSSFNTTPGAGYDAVIAVAAIDSTGAIASFSNYGATTVDLGAPGVAITSTVPTNSYASYSGTSMATPHVTGAVALYASANPTATAAQIRTALLGSTTATPSLSGKTVTGGRLDISTLMAGIAPPNVTVSDASQDEGDTGSTSFIFTVTLSTSSTSTVTIDYATSNGTATAGTDYTATAGTLTFSPGQTSKTVTVFVAGDVTPDVQPLNERVYAELFLTPSSDPWLGLVPPDTYSALDRGGLVVEQTPGLYPRRGGN